MKKIILSIITAISLVINISVYAFNDVDEKNQILKSSADSLCILNVINGYEDGTFRPNDFITRAEFAKICSNLMAKTVDKGYSSSDFGGLRFNDVDYSHWAYNSIIKMSDFQYMVGYGDKTFNPESSITYTEAIKIIVCMLHYDMNINEENGYPDEYLSIADNLGLTKNVEFDPNDYAKRGNIAIIINNSLDMPHMVMNEYSVNSGAVCEQGDITFRMMINNSLK